jgi:hypothetical protein
LTYQQVKNLLEQHASRQVVATGQNCGGIADAVFPNHSFGAGRVDVYASFQALTASA